MTDVTLARLRTALRTAARTVRQVAGIPDYDRYLEHMARAHPGAPVLSRGQFAACAIDRKYRRSGPRCC